MNSPEEDLFSKHRPLIKGKDPSLELLLALTPPAKAHLDLHKKWNLALPYTSIEKLIHDPVDPLGEAQLCYQALIQKPIHRLFIFGPGLGYGLHFILDWLNEKPCRDLILLENELSLLKALVSCFSMRPLLLHPRCHLLWTGAKNFWVKNKKKVEYFLSQPFYIETLPYQLHHRKKEFEEVKSQLIHLSIDLNTHCSEYLQTAPLVYQNILNNFLSLHESKNIIHLKGAFKGIPALICGAGSSLNQNRIEIEKFLNRGLIFAGGRALSVLSDLNIEPHFGLGIDPFDQHKQTLSCNQYFEIPFLYRLRMNFKALNTVHGPKIYVPGSTGYSLVSWLEQELSINRFPFEEGLNVVNFNLSLAHFLGCSPLILVGCDLAYFCKEAYSASIPDEQILPDLGQIDENDFSLNRGYFKMGNQGLEVFTLWKWIEEAEWISSFAKKHSDVTVYNTSLEGLKIEHTELQSLSKLIKKLPSSSQTIKEKLHASLEGIPPMAFKSGKIQSCLEVCIQSLTRLETLWNHMEPIEDMLNEEIAYKHLLKPFEELFLRLDPEHLKEDRCQRKMRFLADKSRELRALFSNFKQANF